MADRPRTAPLLDTFLFSAAYTCIDAARLEAIPVARELASWPLPRTSRSHPERNDLGLQAIADSSFIVQWLRNGLLIGFGSCRPCMPRWVNRCTIEAFS